MAQFFNIHPDNPNARLVRQAVAMLRNGAVIVYPTDSGYALGCHLDDKEAVVRLEDLTYFALYMWATHLKQQISLEDYIKIFETIWQERARAAGWTLVIDGRGRQIYLRFSR